MIYRRGDLALVPFPFTDLSSAKRRPVLVLADPDGYGDFLAVAVTSRPHHSNAIAIRNQDISRGAPPATSWVRTDRVITLNVVLVSKVFGSASSMFVDRVVMHVAHDRRLMIILIIHTGTQAPAPGPRHNHPPPRLNRRTPDAAPYPAQHRPRRAPDPRCRRAGGRGDRPTGGRPQGL